MSDLILIDPNFKEVRYKQEDVKFIGEKWNELKKETKNIQIIVEIISAETPYTRGQIALLLMDQLRKTANNKED